MKVKVFKYIGSSMLALCLYQGTVQAQEVSQESQDAQVSIQASSEDAGGAPLVVESQDAEAVTAVSDSNEVHQSKSDELSEQPVNEHHSVEGSSDVAPSDESQKPAEEVASPAGGTVGFRSPGDSARHYTIKSGDSLWAIANKFGLTVDALLKFNGFVNSSVMLHPGQVIKVSEGSVEKGTQGGQQTSQSSAVTEHVIQSGDSLWRISQRYKITLDDLLKWNKLSSLKVMLLPGQKLIVSQPKGTSEVVVPQDSPKKGEPADASYTIQSGDSFWKIANHYGMTVEELLKLNGFTSVNAMIYPGQVLKVRADKTATNPTPSKPTGALPQLSNRYYQNLSGAQKRFLNSITQAAVNGWSQYQILPSVTLSQAIVESGWGSDANAASKNNYFGVMDRNGQLKRYATVDEGFKHRYEFLQSYKGVAGNQDYRSTLRNIHAGGYAEASNYADALINLIEQYGLQVYDAFVLGR